MSGVRASQRPPLKEPLRWFFFIALFGCASARKLEIQRCTWIYYVCFARIIRMARKTRQRLKCQRPPFKEPLRWFFFIALFGYASAHKLEIQRCTWICYVCFARIIRTARKTRQRLKCQRPPLKRAFSGFLRFLK